MLRWQKFACKFFQAYLMVVYTIDISCAEDANNLSIIALKRKKRIVLRSTSAIYEKLIDFQKKISNSKNAQQYIFISFILKLEACCNKWIVTHFETSVLYIIFVGDLKIEAFGCSESQNYENCDECVNKLQHHYVYLHTKTVYPSKKLVTRIISKISMYYLFLGA